MSPERKLQFDALEQERLKTAGSLNDYFRGGGSVWEDDSLRLIRNLPRPIVIGFNGVLVNTRRPWVANPEARGAIEKLIKSGSVFVVTTASGDWDLRRQALEDFGLWHPSMVLLTRENLTSRIDARKAAISDYLSFSNQELTKAEQTSMMVWEKHLAAVFKKPYLIPIIDDDAFNTSNNPGMLGIQVKTFGGGNLSAEPLPSLQDAAEMARKHYLAPIRQAAPFRDRLVMAPFDKGFRHKSIQMLAQNPNIIMRVYKDYLAIAPNEKHQRYLAARDLFARLTTQFDINVVRHDFVIGPNSDAPDNPIYYIVSERIEGSNLKLKYYSPEEKSAAYEKLETLYCSLAEYLWDVYQNGGWMADLFDAQRSGNLQFVWGKRQEEAEDKIWLVDVDAIISFTNPRFRDHLSIGIPALSKIIEESETKLGVRLERARHKIFQFIDSIPQGDKHYINAFDVKRELGYVAEFLSEEQKKTLVSLVGRYLRTPRHQRMETAETVRREVKALTGVDYQFFGEATDLLEEYRIIRNRPGKKRLSAEVYKRLFEEHVSYEIEKSLRESLACPTEFWGALDSGTLRRALRHIIAEPEIARIMAEAFPKPESA